mmetsp:Transcript_5998/g.12704  ORF Transcript_5998/g.12704 Transcript_5998/m.12704 type:complete len:147 (+) Transcript_5998:98-538(+)
MAFVSGVSALTTQKKQPARCAAVRMSAESVSRREVLAGTAAAFAALVATPALAEIEYANVGFLGGSDQIDVNNANVRVYQKLPGMYPNIAGMICKGGPYDSVADLYKIEGLTDKQKEVLKKYEGNLVALPPRPEYMIDRINNGLYR